MGVIVICGGLILIGLMLWCWKCKKKRRARRQHADSNGSPSGYNLEVRRRRLQTPIFNLAREIGTNDPAYDITKTFAHDLTEVKSPPTIVQEVCEFTGFAQKDLIWIIPLSCVTQVFWIYVGYKILKRCRRNRNTNDRSRNQRAT